MTTSHARIRVAPIVALFAAAVAALACTFALDARAATGHRLPTASALGATPPIAAGKDLRLSGIRKRGRLLIGVAPIVPWAFKDPKGEWYGFEIDVARQLASEIGVTPVFVERPFRDLIEAVVSGQVDVIVSGISITPQRALAIDYSRPYSTSSLEFAVRPNTTLPDALDVAGFTIGVREGSLVEAIARARLTAATLQAFPSDGAAYDALAAGSVGAVLGYAPEARLQALRAPEKFAVGRTRTQLPHSVEGFAVRPREPSLLNVLNAWVEFHRADGWLDDRHREWFESTDWVGRLAQ